MRTDGAWYGAIGVQGWREGQLWTLYAEPGVAYFNKPPLVLWLHGLSLHVFGLGAWQARLPSVLAAALCVIATVGVCRAGGGRGGVGGVTRHGAVSVGVVLALTIEFFRRTREISLDLWQAAFLMLAVWAVAKALASVGRSKMANGWMEGWGGGGWMLLAGVPLGLALMSKPFMGLIAVVLIAVWLAWARSGRLIAWLVGTVGVAALVAGPWHVMMVIEHGEVFTSQYLGAEIVSRATGSFTAGSPWAKPWWFYLEQIGSSYWPWLVGAVLACVCWMRGKRLTHSGQVERWALVWVVGWLVVLSVFPDRRDRYALPVWPGLGVLAGLWIARWPWGWVRRVERWVLSWGWGVLVVGAVVFAALPVRVQKPINPQWPAAIEWLQTEQPEDLWVAGRQTGRMARLYLELGEWPRASHDRWNQPVGSPGMGAMILYHVPDGVVPGANERAVFTSGNLLLTRLETGAWTPRWPE